MKILLLTLFIASCNYQANGKYLTNNTEEANTLDKSEKVKEINRQFEEYRQSFLSVKNILPSEADVLKDTIYVDVREDKEIKVSMIPNAITMKEFSLNEDQFKDKNIVVYCTIGYRSGLFTKKLLDKGFSAFNLKGGVLMWSHADKEFTSNGKPTKKVHVYGGTWDLVNDGYTSVY